MKSNANAIRFCALTAAMTILFAGCGKENDHMPDPVAAQILSTINKMSTRATETVWSPGDAIGVSGRSGSTDYVNVKYSTLDTNGKFTVENTGEEDNAIYFQDEKSVTFTAYYPYTGTKNVAPGIQTIIMTADDYALQKQSQFDFLFAKGTGSASSPEVIFPFTHSMCRIILSFVAGNDIDALSNITYTLSGVRLKGTFNSSDGKAHVDMTAPPTDLTLEVSNAKTMTSSLIFFPGQGGESNKLDLIVTMDGRDYKTTFTPDPNGNDMLGGYSYDCTVKLNKETMTIEEATIKPWDSITNGNIEATN